MTTNFHTISALDGVQKIQRLMLDEGIESFPVMEDNQLVGILTHRDMLGIHPNRIVADAMSTTIVRISPDTSLWKARDSLSASNAEALLVIDDSENILGIVSRTLLLTELGKHSDLLTGLYRSDYAYYQARNLLKNDSEVSFIFIDINNFGHIDKEYGHAMGDEILKEVATLLKRSIPDDAFLCRFGGDEFVIVMPHEPKKCATLADYILETVASFTFHDNICVTVSAGIAGGKKKDNSTHDTFKTITRMINLASLASTKAKKENSKIEIADIYEITDIA